MELFKLLGTIAVSNDEAIKALDETTDKGEATESKLSKAFTNIGGAAVKVGKVVATGVGAAATAISTLTGVAVKSYAEYEQLVGGSQLLFGDAYDFVAEKAKNAYKDVQMSQNEYLQQMNGFATGLKTALGGNEQAAAELASKIITAEADIVAATGNSQEAVQNAFNGIMKSNFTMLDNLQLGITPTKEGFQEVIDKVNEWNKANGEATSYQIDNLADCQAALVDYVEMQGLSEYAANEAAGTISGSIATMKSAWQNLLVGFADSSQDMDVLVSNMVESVATVGSNLIPRVVETLKGVWNAVKTNAPKIFAEIPNMLMSILPQSVRDFMDEAHDWLCDTVMFGLDEVWASIQNLAGAFTPLIDAVNGFLEPLKDMETQQNINLEIVYALEEGLYRLSDVIDIVASVLGSAIQTIVTIGVPAIQAMANVFSTLQAVVSEAIDQYIIPLIQEYVTMIQELLAENQDKINKIGELFTVLGSWISGVIQNVIYPIFQWFVGIVSSCMDNIKTCFQSGFDIIGGIIDFFIALFQGDWQGMWDAVVSILSSAVELVQNWFTLMQEFIASIMNSIWSKIAEIWENIKLSISTKISSIVSAVQTKFQEILNSISEKMESIRLKVSDTWENLVSNTKEKFQSILDGIKEKMELAKSAVSEAIEKIKGFFNFEWHLPELKLPHIKISGEWDLANGTFPSFGVEWYAKGAVLNRPTIFGMNGNNAMVGGEAGAEAVVPIDVLQGYVAQAVASQNAGLVEVLLKILDALLNMREGMKEDFIEALEAMRFELNNREFGRLVKAVR